MSVMSKPKEGSRVMKVYGTVNPVTGLVDYVAAHLLGYARIDARVEGIIGMHAIVVPSSYADYLFGDLD